MFVNIMMAILIKIICNCKIVTRNRHRGNSIVPVPVLVPRRTVIITHEDTDTGVDEDDEETNKTFIRNY
jgi:hypothetical protein